MENKFDLKAGSTYWVWFINLREQKVAAPMTIVEVDGLLKGASISGGVSFDLPTTIVDVKRMNEFLRLNWLKKVAAREGHVDETLKLEYQAYHAMPDAFYRTRVEHLIRVWGGDGGIRSRAVQNELQTLRLVRPDLNIDELQILKVAREKMLDKLLGELEVRVDNLDDDQNNQPSLCDKISNGFRRLFR